MDRLAAINVFIAIVEAGSLSAAGRHLGMPLTTVSRHLAALEDHVGVRLITRTTRDLVLTEAGRHYLDSCRRVIAELEVELEPAAVDIAIQRSLAVRGLPRHSERAVDTPDSFASRPPRHTRTATGAGSNRELPRE